MGSFFFYPSTSIYTPMKQTARFQFKPIEAFIQLNQELLLSPLASLSKMARTTRWCPTPEQLMILEELYRGGLRTPKAPLIQDITAHLSLYGKIEGKNVFYWFQNHKARDKQKLRKMMSMQLLQQRLSFQQFPHQSFVPPTFHELPSHGSSALIPHQDMRRTTRDNNIFKMNQSNEVESCMSKSYGRDWIDDNNNNNTNNMLNIISPSYCTNNNNNNRVPLKTLDLFPTTSSSSHHPVL